MAVRSRDGSTVVSLCLMALVAVLVLLGSVEAKHHLTKDFYDDTCPQIYDIVKAEVQKAVAAETRMAASLIRLHFHDCFVNGCDGSLLLNKTTELGSEKDSPGNFKSARGFAVIDTIKAALEDACPQTVSCADILAIASRDSAVEAGLHPGYSVYFGRRDSLMPHQAVANMSLPRPDFVYPELVKNFHDVGLDEVDLVALSGAHTIGRVSCRIVKIFLNDTNTNALFRERNAKLCPPTDEDDFKVVNLDLTTPDKFDTWYYKNLLVGEGILRSDQTLWSTPGSINMPLVAEYAFNENAFFTQFAESTIKMGNIDPLMGEEGEIRLNCALVNSPPSLVASQ